MTTNAINSDVLSENVVRLCRLGPNLLRIEDVTQCSNGLTTSSHLIGDSYSRLSSKPLGPLEVEQELCFDEYCISGRSRQLLVTLQDAQCEDRHSVGAFRLVLGSEADANSRVPPLEFMGLVDPQVSWHALRSAGFKPEVSLEGGRFALADFVHSQESRESGLLDFLLREIVASLSDIAISLGYEQVWGLLHLSVAAAMRRAGVQFAQEIAVEYKYDEHAALFRKYDKYWQPGLVSLYQLEVERAPDDCNTLP